MAKAYSVVSIATQHACIVILIMLTQLNNKSIYRVTFFGDGSYVADGQEIFAPRGDLPNLNYSPFDAGDYFYAIFGTIGVIIVCSLFIYGFFIQPYYL